MSTRPEGFLNFDKILLNRFNLLILLFQKETLLILCCFINEHNSLQYLKFSLRYTMGNMFGMFLFAFWVIRALKCEVVNFIKFMSAGIPVMPFQYLEAPILIIAHARCICAHDAHAHHDVTRFAYDTNHVTMTSPAFAFHLCHVEMRWHDIIGVNTTSLWFALHGDDVAMTSSCSHCIHIALMMSSHSDHDVIVTHMNHDCSCGM